MTQLAIAILNWNGKHFLERFLPTLLANCNNDTEVVIIDNASEDDSVAFLAENYPQLRVIINEKNYGFAKGYNVGLRQIEAKYYCLLNSDIEVTPHWTEPVIAQMEADENIAAVQPKLLAYHNRTQFEYAGAAGGFLDKYGYPFCRGRFFDVLEEDKGQYDSDIQIFWASGAALFVRSEIYHRLGGLDDDFFAHMEEIDFCWRINNAGYKIMFNHQSVVYHIGGGTLPKDNSFKTYLNYRNDLFLLLKNLPKRRLFITFFIRFFLDILAAFVFLMQGHRKDFNAVFHAMHEFWKGAKAMKQKRGQITEQAFRQTYPHSIVFARFIKGKKYFDGEKLS